MMSTDEMMQSRATTHEWVRERLRRDIMVGAYEPGESLKQTEVATRLQVSVTPVREAMRDLASDGLVVLDPQKVARVRNISESEAWELNELRLLLEPFAARLAALRASPEVAERIETLARRSNAQLSDEEWLEAGQRLHMEVIRATRSPLLIGILENLRQISTIYFTPVVELSDELRAQSDLAHRELSKAISTGEGKRAMEIMHDHLFKRGRQLAPHLLNEGVGTLRSATS